MKNPLYNLVKFWMKANLHLYYGKIKVYGLENVPKDKPVLFLPNHQNALLDVLLLATGCNRKPWFLTRSDVFKSKILVSIFNYFQMIPIYRIRDGRESLKNNDAVFKRCAQLLKKNEAILMFPEANHNLKRRVRPLSKGFTRILFGALDRYPELDIQLVPVGLNYKDAERFPDRVAINFGKPISVKELYRRDDVHASTLVVKEAVAAGLKTLTTHIEDEETYGETIKQLEALGVDYLKPKEANKTLQNISSEGKVMKKSSGILGRIGKAVFTLLNFPLVFLWRTLGKPKVWEPEFMGTLRFAFALLIYPIYYALVFTVFALVWNSIFALGVVLGLFGFNWVFTRLN